jgi:hypothetical protein
MKLILQDMELGKFRKECKYKYKNYGINNQLSTKSSLKIDSSKLNLDLKYVNQLNLDQYLKIIRNFNFIKYNQDQKLQNQKIMLVSEIM